MKIFLLLLFLLPFTAFSQVDAAVKQIVKSEISPLAAKIDSLNSGVYFDTILIINVSKPGSVDTIMEPGIYKLTIEGNASAVRLIYVSRSASGVLSIRTANPLTWSGAGTWSTSVVNNRVIVSTTASNIIYKREKY